MRSAGLEEAQAGIKIAGRNISNLRYADDPILMAESEELKSLLRKVKVESEKVGLKLNIQKTKIMASSPITSLHIDWETMETVRDFIFGGSKITADGDSVQFSCLVMSDSVTPWTVAYQAPPSMEFSKQEYWSGLPFPSPGDLPSSAIEPRSPAL